MKHLTLALVLCSSFACGGLAESGSPTSPDLTTDIASEPAPAVLIGGFINPPAESVVAHDLVLADADGPLRLTFGAQRTGEAIVARINDRMGATVLAEMSPEGLLVLTTVETGPSASLTVTGGQALPMLGLAKGMSASGR